MTARELVYASDHPDVVQQWQANQEAWKQWLDAAHAFIAECAPGAKIVTTRGFSESFRSVHFPNDKIPEGWREEKRTGYYVPDRRRAAGKRISNALKNCQPPRMANLPGMPEIAMGAGHWYSCGLQSVDGVVYANWSVDARPHVEPEVDTDLWREERLSTYYAVLERKAEASERVA